MSPCEKLFFADPYTRDFSSRVLASRDGACCLAATAFYPGGGGQPADTGQLKLVDRALAVQGVRESDDGTIWHEVAENLPAGIAVTGEVNWRRRFELMRRHTLLHIVNALVLRKFEGLITGVHIGEERCSIDFDIRPLTPEERAGLEHDINTVIRSDLETNARWIDEQQFRSMPDLIRTADVKPPVTEGKVRVVEITGFDAQACGGTHVRRTSEVGPCRILKIDNKGKRNRRINLALDSQGGSAI